MTMKTAFNAEDMEAFAPAEKIGLVASIDPEGLPHISLITSIRAASPSGLTLGEFCKGRSKANIQRNPRAGFLVLTRDKKMWRGKARWTHLRNEGPEYEQYNQLPMFRYNTYFGIHTVHYLDLVGATGGERLPAARIVYAALLTRMIRGAAGVSKAERILKPFAEKIFNRMNALKFLAYIAPDGYPWIVPVLQCQAAGSTRLIFSPKAFFEELDHVPDGAQVAVFGLTMEMEDVLVRGRYRKEGRLRSTRFGTVDIEWVYNSMPPCHGQIYPPFRLEAVNSFE
jgi:hypothetical protein